jgi:pyroglutamyl-peptidase
MATILITGFGPFPGAPDNPSAKLIARLSRVRRPTWARHRIVTHVFATSYAAVAHELPALVARHRPEAIVMFGLAGRTPYLRIETQAANRVSALHPDIERKIPSSRLIRMYGPRYLRTRLAPAPLIAAARTAKADARPSRDAGSYVCNFLYWHALEAAGTARGPKAAVFIHVPKPRTTRRRAKASRAPTLEMLARAAEAAIAATITQLPRR